MSNECIGVESTRFDLRLEPDGVYCVDGRFIPVRDNSAICLNNSKPVVRVHVLNNGGVGLLGALRGVDVEQ